MKKSLWNAEDFLAARYRQKKRPFLPSKVLLGFFPGLVKRLKCHVNAFTPLSEAFPFASLIWRETPLGLIYPGMGAPLAAACLELAIAMGARQVLFFGLAGTLDPRIRRSELVAVNGAWSDEGTSRHYGHDGQTPVEGDARLLRHIIQSLESGGLPHRIGPTWTTDGLFRETDSQVQHFAGKGCLTVDMEASALFSVAKHHGIALAGLFLAADSLANSTWTARPPSIRHAHDRAETFFELAAELLTNAPE